MLDSALDFHIICRKSFITVMDTEVCSRYGKWFNPPVHPLQFFPLTHPSKSKWWSMSYLLFDAPDFERLIIRYKLLHYRK